ncbi:MAG: DUF1285 domain-containing protein [Psychrobacter sp.]|nr:DUF1285 domain-containing protein [Psychrobacter sp.]MBP8046264.1 DUF1285 domain-containing protein [Psychrobacter sp.]MBP8816591.1 DUF1285 domain-containing protein [Psychrobacter sp.]MBP9646606.1 DUF1285 domain-containing protein [Psychrobacter sp.]
MNDDNKNDNSNDKDSLKVTNDKVSAPNGMDALSQYFKSAPSIREGRAIPPLENWNPEQVTDMDLTIKANGEWWHEGGHMTRQSLVSLFATILWKEENNGAVEYFLKTPVQKLRIHVEDAPLLINDVGIVEEQGESWLEFTTTTGDVVRLDDEHPISLRAYTMKDSDDNSHSDKSKNKEDNKSTESSTQIRPYMMVRNGLEALIGRNAFYHLTEIGELTEREGETILTLQSGDNAYTLSMPSDS